MPEFPDAGPHPTPDDILTAQKRRAAALTAVGRSAQPEQRHATETETVARKLAAKKR